MAREIPHRGLPRGISREMGRPPTTHPWIFREMRFPGTPGRFSGILDAQPDSFPGYFQDVQPSSRASASASEKLAMWGGAKWSFFAMLYA